MFQVNNGWQRSTLMKLWLLHWLEIWYKVFNEEVFLTQCFLCSVWAEGGSAGNSWTQRSSVGNFILGTTVFNTEEEPDGCLRVSGHLKETHIVLVNTQGRRTRGGCGCFNTHTFLSERVQHFFCSFAQRSHYSRSVSLAALFLRSLQLPPLPLPLLLLLQTWHPWSEVYKAPSTKCHQVIPPIYTFTHSHTYRYIQETERNQIQHL